MQSFIGSNSRARTGFEDREIEYLDLGGTIRSRTAAETLAIMTPRLPSYGITRVAHITGLDCLGIPVSVCIRPNARDLAVSQGKGLTQELADVSAIMESIEFHHAEHLAPAGLVGCYRELASRHHLIDVETLCPGPFAWRGEAGVSRGWRLGKELHTGREIWMPRAAISLDTTRAEPETASVLACSTGLASGNNLDEALCHAICEIIESESIASWLELGPRERAATEIDLESVVGHNRALLDGLRRGGVNVRIWDLTGRLGVPAFRCVIDGGSRGVTLGAFAGAGAHLSPHVALSRAITEAAQSRLTIISGSRDDVLPSMYSTFRLSRPVTEGDDPRPSKRYRGGPAAEAGEGAGAGAGFAGDLRDLLARLARHSFATVAATVLSAASDPFVVVRVLIPGMRDKGHRI